MKVKLIVLFLWAGVAGITSAQKTIKLQQADKIIGRKEGNERYDWVVGNVIFTQNQTTIYCDSARRNKKENSLQAFGKIKITDGDSIIITAKSLSYDGNKRMASLRKEVVFEKLKTATLYTDFLDFDRERNKANYFNGGKLVDSTNTLTSKKGYYDTRSNLASFKTNVVGVNKDATMTSDTLQYHTKTKVVYFQDKTLVKDAEGKTATYTSGFFDTNTKQSNIKKGTMESNSYIMVGDHYELDDRRQFYRAKGHVVMTSKDENMTIYGDQGDYDKANGITKVFGRSFIAKVDAPGDTLFITADTLISIDSKDPRKKRLLAYHDVKIFKNDMQGLADSLVYVQADSMLHFFRKPVLWNGENQMTSDTIRMQMRNKNIDKIFMISSAFIASVDSLGNYNQIKSRLMTTHFKGKQIHHVDVIGNGQSLYFVTEEKEVKDSTAVLRITFLTGMNKIECSNMKINFANGKLNNITFIKKPDASFIPPHEIKKADTQLPGFLWRGADKPTRNAVVKQPIAQPPPTNDPLPKESQ